MNWENILKMMGPRDFMEALQEKLGGEIKGGWTKRDNSRGHQHRLEMQLNTDSGWIKLAYKGDKYLLSFNLGENKSGTGSNYSLKKLLEELLDILG
jgi:hypothetical protein